MQVLDCAGATKVMGVLNLTPDSFSDGGRYVSCEAGLAHAVEMIEAGAQIIDVGGESTRPGATALTSEEEWARIGEVVRELAHIRRSVPSFEISVDTYHAATAEAAIDAGVTIINDVTGGLGDKQMFATLAGSEIRYILQHGRGSAQTMDGLATYSEVSTDVAGEIATRIEAAVAAGIAPESIVVDPGFGFAKNSQQNWALAAHLAPIQELGLPVLVGVSRKRFLAELSDSHHDDITAALTMYFALNGAWGVRVHDVAASVAAVRTAARLAQEWRA